MLRPLPRSMALLLLLLAVVALLLLGRGRGGAAAGGSSRGPAAGPAAGRGGRGGGRAGGRAGAVGWLADMLRLDWATPYPRPPLFSRRATRGGIRRFCTSYLIISRLFSFFWRVGSI